MFALCEIAGGSNLNTSQSYIAEDEDRLKEIVERITNALRTRGCNSAESRET